jgi:hypothetical protein
MPVKDVGEKAAQKPALKRLKQLTFNRPRKSNTTKVAQT